MTRGKGKTLPSGGTLVLGREQDCLGGCFDSMSGSTGKVDTNSYREYGPQDFFGVMDEMRIWKTVRSREQIRAVRSLSSPFKNTSNFGFARSILGLGLFSRIPSLFILIFQVSFTRSFFSNVNFMSLNCFHQNETGISCEW